MASTDISRELQALMHAVLDGEATLEQAELLERELAANPEARAEYDQLRSLFREMAALSQPHPPEGLVAAVDAALPGFSHRASQPLAASRVLGSTADDLYTAAAKGFPAPPFHPRSESMSQSTSIFAHRKTWVGAGFAALAAVLVVTQYSGDLPPKQGDVAGTIVPAERYRAAQPGAADIKLGDQSVAQLMQNDSFVKLIKDPAVQELARSPAFQDAARFMLSNADAARHLLANTDMAKFYAANADAAKALLANADAAKSVMANADAAKALMANADAAKFVAANADLAKFVAANADAAKFFAANNDAAKFFAANNDAAKFFAANADAARFFMLNADAARVMLNSDAARVLLANADAARTLMANADMSRHLLANTDAARNVLANAAMENAAMEKKTR